jgi:hypothetical protein
MERQSYNKNLQRVVDELSEIKEEHCSEDATNFYRIAVASPFLGTAIGMIADGWSGAGYGFLAGLGGAFAYGFLGYFHDMLEEA